MTLSLYQIDAFTDRVFGGNPAAVVPLDAWLPDAQLQRIAAENNLSETAFFVPHGNESNHFQLRWFTPTTEVELCGHATLAAAYVLFHELGCDVPEIRFATAGDELMVRRDGALLELDFPARPALPVAANPDAMNALGIPDVKAALLQSRDLLVVLDSEAQVRALRPDFLALSELDCFGICVTAPGDTCDFVSRFFAPRQGIDEDPVTGSAHCTLVPYWVERFGKNELFARQVSSRGGDLRCRLDGNRVRIAGQARCYLRGQIFLEADA